MQDNYWLFGLPWGLLILLLLGSIPLARLSWLKRALWVVISIFLVLGVLLILTMAGCGQ